MSGYKQIDGIEALQDGCCNSGTQVIESKNESFANKIELSSVPHMLSTDEDTPLLSEDDSPTVVVDINRDGDEARSTLLSVEEVERFKSKLKSRIRPQERKNNRRNVLNRYMLNSPFLSCILPWISGFTVAFLLNLSWLYLVVTLVVCPIVIFLTLGFLEKINLISPFWCGSQGMPYLIQALVMCDIGMMAAIIVNRIFF